jgi:hypothetical protein
MQPAHMSASRINGSLSSRRLRTGSKDTPTEPQGIRQLGGLFAVDPIHKDPRYIQLTVGLI